MDEQLQPVKWLLDNRNLPDFRIKAVGPVDEINDHCKHLLSRLGPLYAATYKKEAKALERKGIAPGPCDTHLLPVSSKLWDTITALEGLHISCESFDKGTRRRIRASVSVDEIEKFARAAQQAIEEAEKEL